MKILLNLKRNWPQIWYETNGIKIQTLNNEMSPIKLMVKKSSFSMLIFNLVGGHIK